VSAGSLLITNNSAFVGDVGIGTTTPGVPLDVNGVIRTQTQVHANEYCDENGSNCFTATSVGTSTAGWDYISKKDHPGDGNFVTFITGFSGSPANVEVDLVAKGSECGYDVGDVIYNVGSTNNTTSDRNHDEGMVVAGDSSGLIAIKISARGLSVIRVDNIFYAWDDCQLTPSNWSVVVKADEGDIH